MTKIVTIQAQQKWDYATLVRKTETSLLAELNLAGQEGWELINVLYYKDLKGAMSWIGYLKRPNAGQPPRPMAHEGSAVHMPAQVEEAQVDSQGFDLSDQEFGLKD